MSIRYLWAHTQRAYFTLRNSLSEAVELTKNDDFDKYKYSGKGVGFDSWGSFLLFDGRKKEDVLEKNLIVLGAVMSLSVHFHNKERCNSIKTIII